MAVLSVTAANVLAAASATTIDGTAGATITAGQALYYDTATSTYKLCDADASLAAGKLAGVALNGCAATQPVKVLTAGNYNPGATVAVGVVYTSAATAGGIGPVADQVATWTANVLGIATTTSNILVNIVNGQVLVA